MSDIVSEGCVLFKVLCNSCKHYLREKMDGSCKAFDEIPSEIITGKVGHDKVLEGQKGEFVYTQE